MNRIDRSASTATAPPLTSGRSRTLHAELRPKPFALVQPIRILVASNQPIVRDGIRGLLERQADFRVVGEARDGREALFGVRDLNPDVLLLDFGTAGASWLDVMRELKLGGLRTRTIVVTSEVERADMIELLQFGGRGVIQGGTPTDLLFKCIRRVHEGDVWISREMTAQVVELLAARAVQQVAVEPAREPEPIRVFSLTPREREILKLVANGESNKGVASRLSIGQDTVKHHLTSMFNKTGTSTRLELALFAFDHHLVKRD